MPDTYRDARILVVDDVPVNVKLLLGLLQQYGYRNVQGISDPRQVEPLLREQLPDLLLLDINMPHLSGHDILRLLRETWAEQAPPVIVLTAQTDRETRLRALGLGARDLITKPFERLEVAQRIHNTLELHFLLKERQARAGLLQSLVDERTAEIQRLSLQDPVTSLPNRRILLQQLEQEMSEGRIAGLIYIALDGFEEIAGVHGYTVKDSLSQQLRDRLQCHLGEGDCLAVWSSTKWVLLSRGYSQERIVGQARAIVDCVAVPFHVEHLMFKLTVRLGVSHSDMAHESAEHLVRMAAQALPEQKNSWRFYDASFGDALQKRLHYRQALGEAIARGQMFLVYQPKVELCSGRVVGAEALLRWAHPELGFVSPVEFIPLAEASGEILRIGEWVFDQAISQLEAWFAAGQVPPGFAVAVNVATLQLMQPDFAVSLLARLQRSRLPMGAIEIEVTESGLMQDIELARKQLQQLASHGVPIAVDDFGTGHSSLAYLKNLPLSVLKIDRAFVGDMDHNLQDRRLVETVIQVAHNFGFTTVAEGIERPAQVALLSQMRCGVGQGYWYSPPLGAEAFVEFCQRERAPATPMVVLADMAGA